MLVASGALFGLPETVQETSAIDRDVHDRQLLPAPDGRVGVLGFDTLALGDPALDLATLTVQLELRGAAAQRRS